MDGWPKHLAPPQIVSSGDKDGASNLQTVLEISKVLESAADLETLLDRAIDEILEVIVADRAYIFVSDPETGRLTAHTPRRSEQGLNRLRPEVSRTIILKAIESGEPIISNDASFDERFGQSPSIVNFGIRSVLCVPMRQGDTLVGVVQLHRTYRDTPFTEPDAQLLRSISAMVAVAIQNHRLWTENDRSRRVLRTTQQALARTQQELVDREAMAMIGRVTSGLVHEIRNCLSPLMLADLIFEEYSADSRIQEAAELMVEAHQRIMTLVESISSQAKGEDPTINLVAARPARRR